jgi:hypothetical protein
MFKDDPQADEYDKHGRYFPIYREPITTSSCNYFSDDDIHKRAYLKSKHNLISNEGRIKGFNTVRSIKASAT